MKLSFIFVALSFFLSLKGQESDWFSVHPNELKKWQNMKPKVAVDPNGRFVCPSNDLIFKLFLKDFHINVKTGDFVFGGRISFSVQCEGGLLDLDGKVSIWQGSKKGHSNSLNLNRSLAQSDSLGYFEVNAMIQEGEYLVLLMDDSLIVASVKLKDFLPRGFSIKEGDTSFFGENISLDTSCKIIFGSVSSGDNLISELSLKTAAGIVIRRGSEDLEVLHWKYTLLSEDDKPISFHQFSKFVSPEYILIRNSMCAIRNVRIVEVICKDGDRLISVKPLELKIIKK